jgi:hypothetical protein
VERKASKVNECSGFKHHQAFSGLEKEGVKQVPLKLGQIHVPLSWFGLIK